jgi:hypothetical protein
VGVGVYLLAREKEGEGIFLVDWRERVPSREKRRWRAYFGSLIGDLGPLSGGPVVVHFFRKKRAFFGGWSA